MPASPVHGLRTWAALWRIRALHELHYRANLAINVFQVGVDIAIGVIAIRLVFANTDSLNGWSEAELLIVLGAYTMLDAIFRAVVWPNMAAIVSDVKDGTLDGVLVMPADDQLIVTTRELSVWDLSGVVIGAGVVAYGAGQLGGVGPSAIASFALLFVVGLAIVYSFFLAVTSLAFRLVDIEDLLFRLFQGASSSGRWPIGIYPGWLQAALTAIVPIAVAVSVPSSALTGRLSPWAFALSITVGVAAVAASRWVFRRGLRAYSGASA
jgi:ABC-2 type transport system permease protein